MTSDRLQEVIKPTAGCNHFPALDDAVKLRDIELVPMTPVPAATKSLPIPAQPW